LVCPLPGWVKLGRGYCACSQVGLAVGLEPGPGILLRQHLRELVLDQAPRGDTDAKALQRAFQLPAVPVQP
jgi:hypothetical protein